MKKARWDTLPTATTAKKGLMSTAAYMGYAGNTASIGLTSSSSGFLVKTDITNPTSTRILFSIKEGNISSNADYVINIYFDSSGTILGNVSRSGQSLSRIELLNNNGTLYLYVVPGDTTGYIGVVSVFAYSSTGMMPVNVSIIVGEKPSGAVVLREIEI